MYLYTEARERLSTQGIEITSVSMGGEAEEIYDETGDDYFYTASLSLSVLTDWSIHVPLPITLTRAIPTTVTQAQAVAGLSDDELLAMGTPNGLVAVTDLDLISVQDPWFNGRSKTYDVIR